VAEYYGTKSLGGGLIISEGTVSIPRRRGYLVHLGSIAMSTSLPGGKSGSRHAKGGYIFMQLWHVGRVSTSKWSAVKCRSHLRSFVRGHCVYTKGWVKTSPHRELKLEEIPGLVRRVRKAAKNARAAGFEASRSMARMATYDRFSGWQQQADRRLRRSSREPRSALVLKRWSSS